MAKGPDEVVAEIGTTRITQRELSCLEGEEWLTDPVMDTYLSLITTRNREQEGYPSVYSFRSTFYTLLSAKDGIKNTQETTQNENILSYDIILFPACVCHHWRMIVVKPQEKTIEAYNSLESKDLQICLNIQRFMCKEEEMHGRMKSQWDIKFVKDIPQQGNSNDCGPFALTYAEYLARGQNQFDFLQEHIPYFRKRMMYEIISGRLLGR
ncbi:unnamed protein product [Orchesella dallaii]|uniref:Ubiquitin-like protease family profile domain-containing protein n=1 Tax=Orchesella dallaii TaxID=48710 RepID=A0ABP1S6I3_9HEXA